MRKAVVEVQCSRCARVETIPFHEGMAQTEEPVFTASLSLRPSVALTPARITTFDDLCTPCFNTVQSLLVQIGKKVEGVSPKREPRAKNVKVVVDETGAGVGTEPVAKVASVTVEHAAKGKTPPHTGTTSSGHSAAKGSAASKP